MNYLECLGRNFPQVAAVCRGDPAQYEDIETAGEEPLPTKDELDAKDLENRRDDKWYEIERERDRREITGGTKVTVGEDEYWFHSDESSKIKQLSFAFMALLANIGLIEEFPPIPWRLMDKRFVPMTGPLALLVFSSAVMNTSEVFAVAHAHRTTMLTRPDPDGYDYSSGWPECFQDRHPNVTE